MNGAPAAKIPRVPLTLPIPERPKRSAKLLVCGQGDMGQLGLGEDKMESRFPTAVASLPDIVDCCAGGMHSLCLTQTGDIYSFGCNDEGALGRDTSEDGSEFEPRKMDLPGQAVKICAGDSHSACLLEDGRVFACGSFRNSHGNMGLTLEGNKWRPVNILPGVEAHDISSGADHLVILACNGNVFTIGCAEQGQLGRVPLRDAGGDSRRGKDELLNPQTIHVKHKKQFDSIWTTIYCTFVRKNKEGDVYAFGLNNYNQLCMPKTDMPVPVPKKTSLKDVLAIAGGQHHTLVLTSDNKCHSIGRRDYGRLGLGELSEDVAELTAVKALQEREVVQISCGEAQSFAVTKDGEVYAWGMGSNQSLGTGKEDDEMVPVLLNSKEVKGKKVLKVTSGGQHSLFLVDGEELKPVCTYISSTKKQSMR